MTIAEIVRAGARIVTAVLSSAVAKRRHLLGVLIGVSLGLLPRTSVALPIKETIDTDEFKVFSSALKKTGLWDRITSEDGITLFVVSDKAMRDEGSAFLLEKVLATRYNQQRLLKLMSYHVYFGTPLFPGNIQREVKLNSGSGSCLSVYRSGTGIRIGPEAVVTDVKVVDGGIIYVIDRLLWQPWKDEANCRELVAKAP
jgi:uncharacterized surface protein with fasciclin (FAS1) repeats